MPNSLEEAMGLRGSARGRPQSATASPGTRQRGRAARQKAVLLVLLVAMPEAWWHLVHLSRFPRKACIAGSVKHSDSLSLLLKKPGSTYLLFSKCRPKATRLLKAKKRLPALK